MFTLDQINHIHDRLGKPSTLADYLADLYAIGVERYDSFISDGHSEYYGANGHKVVSPPAHKLLEVARTINNNALLHHLQLHEEGETDYFEMS